MLLILALLHLSLIIIIIIIIRIMIGYWMSSNEKLVMFQRVANSLLLPVKVFKFVILKSETLILSI